MNIYWKDIGEAERWAGLLVRVEDRIGRPPLHLQSYQNSRIRLLNQGSPVFWASLVKDYAGVWLAKATSKPNTKIELLPSITSSHIEERSHLQGHDGGWLFGICQGTIKKDVWSYKAIGKVPSNENTYIHDVKDCLSRKGLDWIDWWSCGSGCLINLKQPDPHSGRVKWWRKKNREGRLPPLLCWYINCLDAYVLIDGHDRLQASLMEGVPPDIIFANSVEEYKSSLDEATRQRIVNSLLNRPKNARKKISTENMNQVLIQAFDDRPRMYSKTYSWAAMESESAWISELQTHLEATGDMGIIKPHSIEQPRRNHLTLCRHANITPKVTAANGAGTSSAHAAFFMGVFALFVLLTHKMKPL